MPSFQMHAVLGWVLLASACSSSAASEPEAPPRFVVATPEVRSASLEREYVAEIRAARHAELRSRLKGVLETVAVDEGQRVKAGQLLFTVNARALEQEVRVARASTLGAQAELEAARLELENTRLLQQKNVVSAAELALAESKVQTLRAKLAEAKANTERAQAELSFAEVKAPFDGVVNRIPNKAGGAIAEDGLLTTLTDTSEVFAYFRISEREYLEHAHAPETRPRAARLRLVDGRTFPIEGVIDAVASELDRETGTLTYRARFANPEGTLRHGSSGKVVLETDFPQALLVPQKATFDVQGNLFVYVVDSNDVPRARKILVKARLDTAFVIESGLAAGERFVLEGVQKVKDGTRIEIAPPAAATRAATTPGG